MSRLLAAFALVLVAMPAHAQGVAPAPATVVETIDTLLVRGDRLSRSVASQLDAARRFERIDRARCLDAVLSQVNAARRQLLFRRDAVTRQGADVRQHARMTRALAERFVSLQGDARVCVGASRTRPRSGTELSVYVPPQFRDLAVDPAGRSGLTSAATCRRTMTPRS